MLSWCRVLQGWQGSLAVSYCTTLKKGVVKFRLLLMFSLLLFCKPLGLQKWEFHSFLKGLRVRSVFSFESLATNWTAAIVMVVLYIWCLSLCPLFFWVWSCFHVNSQSTCSKSANYSPINECNYCKFTLSETFFQLSVYKLMESNASVWELCKAARKENLFSIHICLCCMFLTSVEKLLRDWNWKWLEMLFCCKRWRIGTIFPSK